MSLHSTPEQHTYQFTVARLARELADLGRYPVEETLRDGKCAACLYPVRARHGMFAWSTTDPGSDTFPGVDLHPACAADVRRAQESGKVTVSL